MQVTDFCIGYDKHTVPHADKPSSAMLELHAVAALCNAAQFDITTIHLPLAEQKIHGDATDSSILRFAEGIRPIQDLNDGWKRVHEVAFNSKSKFMLSMYAEVNEKGTEGD